MTFSAHAESTAEQVADALSVEILGKNVLVTGTTINGLGFETARAIAKYANLVIITGRNAERLQLSEDTIKKEFPSANVRKLTLDLSSLAAVRTAAAEINAYAEPLHVLINNATAAVTHYSVTSDNFEAQMATSHIGPFLFTNLVAPKLLAARTATYTPRVIFLSSLGHRMVSGVDFATFAQPLPDKYGSILDPYHEAKSANILTAIELSRRAKGKLVSFSLHPGAIRTNGSRQEEIIAALHELGLYDESGELNPGLGIAWKTIPQGAATTLVAAFDPSLSDKPGAFLNDCQVANELVAPHSSDFANAEKLWAVTERALGQSFDF